MSWRDQPLIGLGAGLAMLVAMGILISGMRGCLKGPPKGPELGYQCSVCDNAWQQPRSIGASCPDCGELGCTTVQAQCRSCKHEFAAWQTRQIGPGKFEHRLAVTAGSTAAGSTAATTTTGPSSWLGTPPSPLRCPKCRRQGTFDEGGQFFNPPQTIDDDDRDEGTPSKPPASPVIE